jgi:class 3 adenylate cyclase
MERHGTVIREVVECYRGREVDSTGDGFLLAFDGAARAVHAAVDIRRSVSAIGLQVRVRVHTGEVEVVPGGLRGVTVHETARIMGLGKGARCCCPTSPRTWPKELLTSTRIAVCMTSGGSHGSPCLRGRVT